MKIAKHFTIFTAFLSISSAVIAQVPKEERSLDNGPIEGQFEYLIEKSNRYEDYKVIKITSINKLKSNVSDSLQALRKELNKTLELVAAQENEIASKNAELVNTNDNLTFVNQEKNSIDLFGFLIEKSIYKNTIWSIVGALLIFLLLYIYRFKRSNVLTTQAKRSFADIQEEFNEYKKRALEKEQKLARELQNELNKRPPAKW